MTYTGWISAVESDRAELEEMGVVVGPWNADAMVFDNCQLSDDTLHQLQHLKHRIHIQIEQPSRWRPW